MTAPRQVIGYEPATGRRWYRSPAGEGRAGEAEIVRRLNSWAEFWRKVDAGEIVLGPPREVRER